VGASGGGEHGDVAEEEVPLGLAALKMGAARVRVDLQVAFAADPAPPVPGAIEMDAEGKKVMALRAAAQNGLGEEVVIVVLLIHQ
jgi:hypothetical protein